MLHAAMSALIALAVFISVIGVFPASAEEAEPANATVSHSYFYNGTSAWLELSDSKPMRVSFYNVNSSKLLAEVDLAANASSVNANFTAGANGTQMNFLSILFDTPIKNDNGTTIDRIAITLEMQVDAVNQRWSLLSLKLDYKVTNATGDGKSQEQVDEPPVFTRTGFTPKKEDTQCARGYAVCAPLNLCWTCSSQEAKPNMTKAAEANHVISAGIVFPGMVLQPFVQGSNGTQPLQQFGNSWDCDPVFSIYLWQGLGLSFLLCLVLWWAITMMTTIHINTLFDDPKGPRIMVPTSD